MLKWFFTTKDKETSAPVLGRTEEADNSSGKRLWQKDPQDHFVRFAELNDFWRWAATRKFWFYDHPAGKPLTPQEQIRALAYVITDKGNEGWQFLAEPSRENSRLVFRTGGEVQVIPYQDAKALAKNFLTSLSLEYPKARAPLLFYNACRPGS